MPPGGDVLIIPFLFSLSFDFLLHIARQRLRPVFQPDKHRKRGRQHLSHQLIVNGVVQVAEEFDRRGQTAHAPELFLAFRPENMKQTAPVPDARRNASELAAGVHTVVQHGHGGSGRRNPVGLGNACNADFHAVMQQGIKLSVPRRAQAGGSDVLDAQGKAAAGAFVHDRKVDHLSGADQGTQAEHLQILKAELLAVMGLPAPFRPQPFHLILHVLDRALLQTKAFGRDDALRREAGTDDVCGDGVDTGLGDTVVAVQIVHPGDGQIALERRQATGLYPGRQVVFQGTTKRPGV